MVTTLVQIIIFGDWVGHTLRICFGLVKSILVGGSTVEIGVRKLFDRVQGH